MNHNQLLLVTFFGAIALFPPAPRAILAETSPPIIAQSAELQEAERLIQQLFQLYQQGNYPEAISLAEKVLAIYEKAYGPDRPEVAQALNNLAALYNLRGNYTKAFPLFQRAIAILEKSLGPEHPLLASSLDNLAQLYQGQRKYQEAEPLFQRALAIREGAFAPDHPEVAKALNNLAVLYFIRRKYAEAEPLYQRLLAINEGTLGPEHPDLATSIHNLGNLYRLQGKYDEAEPLFQRALAIREKVLGPQHPLVATTINSLGALYNVRGDSSSAVDFFHRALAVEEYNIDLNLLVGSESSKRQYMETLTGTTYAYISAHFQSAPNNLEAARLALRAILQRKGRVLDAVSNNLETIRENLTPANRSLLEELAAVRSEIATLVFSGTGDTFPERYRELLGSLEKKAEEIETKLAAASAEFRVESQAITIEAVQELIPQDAVLVEFMLYKPFDFENATAAPPRYVAYVLHSAGDPQWVDLGDAGAIDRAVLDFRKALRQQPSTSEQQPRRLTGNIEKLTVEQIKEKARALDEMIMRPVRDLLQNKSQLLLSPDSQLNLIPFAALVDEQSRFLVETYNITYLTSGRDLLKLQLPTPKLEAPLIVGNPDFDLDAAETNTLVATRGGNTRAGDLSLLSYNSLPGTEAEIKAIAPLLSEAAVLDAEDATEEAVTEIVKPRVLHLATHGFFLKNAAEEAENPLLRSGLALAGFNNRGAIASNLDGVLTALEVSGLNLRGTQLVVMSACETGLGEVANGDGVYGLRRAFTIAGVESQLMSLWKVDDLRTQEMMVGYYQRLKDGMGRSEALRDIQLEMLNKYEYPYYWGSFIPAGNWEPMEEGF
ncbi:MAG: CHAT domain-containing protein [Cyanobacteriota bacterium]|nr:CHAT domain-containing protein [Cyanobacteriota bacterium]